jgi:hypothetical protein
VIPSLRRDALLPPPMQSFISHRLAAFLNWSGSRTEIFNAGQRRRHDAQNVPCENRRQNADAQFFDPADEVAKATRERIAMSTVDELLAWFDLGGEIGILDATNSTRSRRAALVERAKEYSAATGQSVSVVFIESLCDEADVLEANMLTKISASPDFAGLSESAAVADLKQRIENYERVCASGMACDARVALHLSFESPNDRSPLRSCRPMRVFPGTRRWTTRRARTSR